jgi:hypothetical protein
MPMSDGNGHGGARKGAGRKPGMQTEKTVLARKLAVQGMRSALQLGVSPLDIMRARMLDEPLPNGKRVTDEQYLAARDCAPYMHPKLAMAVVKDVTSSAPTTSVERIRRIEQLLLETASDDQVVEGTAEHSFIEDEPS